MQTDTTSSATSQDASHDHRSTQAIIGRQWLRPASRFATVKVMSRLRMPSYFSSVLTRSSSANAGPETGPTPQANQANVGNKAHVARAIQNATGNASMRNAIRRSRAIHIHCEVRTLLHNARVDALRLLRSGLAIVQGFLESSSDNCRRHICG